MSVMESAVLTKEFILTFLTEFYLQLTTISWLSVRTVQRQSKSSQDETPSSSSELWSGFISTLSSLVSSNVESSAGRQDDWHDVDVDIVSRAEERVRLAEELAHNNSLARARLGLTKIIRYLLHFLDIVDNK